ncbi:pentatricopeptide repeat-containing protein At4g39530-like [Phalaenopsis equestris]|uniref:pentatricopeptide repeat-containing protein At4g39530-like n=1 Tax=Phalaenopsis equestris TaxID=78828 RepID=UPI0009E52411|nr:pentatricopeptide repeat-containing protein At4g39530-like [Phalaenopsis equestris]
MVPMFPLNMTVAPTVASPPIKLTLPPKRETLKTPLKILLRNPSLHDEVLHAHLIKSGLLSCTSICNTLIHRYSDSRRILLAQQVFDEMPQQNLVSWTTLISGNARLGKSGVTLETFVCMLDDGFIPNEFAFGSALRSCSDSGYFQFGAQLHGLIMKMGLLLNIFVASGLILMYSKHNEFDTAMEILERMKEKDVFSWTTMIVGFSKGNKHFEAMNVFAQMLEEGLMAGEFALTSILKACASSLCIREGSQVHGYAIKTRFENDASVRASIIDFYVKIGDILSARLVFDRSPCYDLVMCTVIIGAYAQHGNTELAIMMFHQMIREFGILPNEYTLASLLASTAKTGDVILGANLHSLALKSGYAAFIHVQGALIDMYAKNGMMEDASAVFNDMETKDSISCSSLLAGYSCNGFVREALEFFLNLHKSSVKPDPFTIASAMTLCAKLGDQLQGKQIHAQIIKQGHEFDTCIASTLIDMYAKSGSIEDASKVFENLSTKDRIAWTALIDGYAQHGMGINALESFSKMIEDGIYPNVVTFVSLLNACSHSGLIKDGISLFELMKSIYGIEPVIHHYTCMVDLLGRAGRLEEALEFIKAMPIEPTHLIWRSFLGACRNHNNIELGIEASKHLLELDPDDDAIYVLLSNMYSLNGRWNDAAEIRNVMKLRSVTKSPGLSWVELHNNLHVFGAGDDCHPEKELIYNVLSDLMLNMKEAGYVPETALIA